MTDEWIKIFVIPNKWNYNEWSEQFIKDYKISSWIPNSIPIKAGKKYFIIEHFQYCGAQVCPFWVNELRELIKSNKLILK
jgi:hypothetical protein